MQKKERGRGRTPVFSQARMNNGKSSLRRSQAMKCKPAGLHFIAWLRRREDLPLFMRACEKTGVRPRPLSFFCIKTQLDPAFVFGFAAWSQAQIEQGLAKLALAVKHLKQRGAGNVSSFQIHPFPPATSSYWPSTAVRSN